MKPPSIAIVVHDFDPSFGQGRYVCELVRNLPGRFEFHVLANTFGEGSPSEIVRHRVPAWRRTALSTVFSFLAFSEPRVRALSCDLIHAQGLSCWSADVITGHMCNAAKYEAMPPASPRAAWFPRLVIPVENNFFRSRRPRHLIAISKRFGGEIRRHYGWDRPTTLIYHGVDTTTFQPATAEQRRSARERFGVSQKDWVWLFVGEAAKGLREAISQLPNFRDARLLVASRSTPNEFFAFATTLGVAERLHFAGFLSSPSEAYHAADVFLYPSPYDPFGLVVGEAMACGLPVVTNPNLGVAELITHGKDGLLASPGKPEEWTRALSTLLDGERARALGSMARKTMLPLSWATCANQTAAVYESLLDASRSGSSGLKEEPKK